ncbi:MAG: CBS domain-containing protein [Thiovulaceae bacterium]|nr:CBS domain-containing protein [Sulfurimonadaceae bacterium]
MQIQNDKNYPVGILDYFITIFKVIIIIILTSIVSSYLAHVGSIWITLLASISLSIIILLIFGKLIPSLIGKLYKKTSLSILMGVVFITSPLKKPYFRIMKRYADEIDQNINETEEQIIKEIIEPEKKELIKGIIGFSSTQVREIMTPRADISGINFMFSRQEMLTKAIDSGFSRLPVYKNSFDEIVGFIYIKDLLGFIKNNEFSEEWHNLIRGAHFTQCSKPINELLDELRENKIHMAIVLDENKKCSGLITLEDIVEEIVGEISDETDNSF